MARILRILIVEDGPERQEILKKLFKDHAWILVHTAERAKRLLSVYDFDLICLDFDLAGPGHGDDVAAFIAKSRNGKAKVLVHSMNAPGANRILEFLPTAIYIPLSKITKDNKTFKRIRQILLNSDNIDRDVMVND